MCAVVALHRQSGDKRGGTTKRRTRSGQLWHPPTDLSGMSATLFLARYGWDCGDSGTPLSIAPCDVGIVGDVGNVGDVGIVGDVR